MLVLPRIKRTKPIKGGHLFKTQGLTALGFVLPVHASRDRCTVSKSESGLYKAKNLTFVKTNQRSLYDIDIRA